MTTPDPKALRALADDASTGEGEWTAEASTHPIYGGAWDVYDAARGLICEAWTGERARYIAAVSPATVLALLDRLEAAEAWSEDDVPLPEDDAIKAAFPTRSGNHKAYAEAQRMVSAKYSKIVGTLAGSVPDRYGRYPLSVSSGRRRRVLWFAPEYLRIPGDDAAALDAAKGGVA